MIEKNKQEAMKTKTAGCYKSTLCKESYDESSSSESESLLLEISVATL